MVFTSRDMHTCSFSRPSAGEGLRRVGHPEGELIRFALAALGFRAAEASQRFRRAMLSPCEAGGAWGPLRLARCAPAPQAALRSDSCCSGWYRGRNLGLRQLSAPLSGSSWSEDILQRISY